MTNMRHMKPLRILKLGVAALVLTASTASPSFGADGVRMMFDWIPSGWHAVWYAGRVNGCFGDRNLDISLERGSGGVDTVAKVASGLADVGLADLGTMMIGAHRNGAAVKAIFPVYMDSPFGILSLESTGVASLKDLEGLKLAAGPGDSNIQILPHAMQLAGADFEKVHTERADFSALLGLLLQEKVDVFTTFLTTAQILKTVSMKAGKEVAFYHYGKDLNVYGSVVFATDDFLKTRPDVAMRLMDGMQCAYEAARADLDAAADALLAEFPSKKRDAELAAIRGGSILTFEADAYGKHGFAWDMDRVARTFELSLKAQGEDVQGSAGAAYVHTFE